MAKRARRAAAFVGGGMMNRAKHNGMPAILGGAAEFVLDYGADHAEFIRNKYWGGPLALFVAAAATNIVFKHGQKALYAGHALAGAAGFLLAFNYKLKQFQDGVPNAKSPVLWFGDKPMPGAGAGAAAPPAGTNAPDDTGMGYGGPETGMGYEGRPGGQYN